MGKGLDGVASASCPQEPFAYVASWTRKRSTARLRVSLDAAVRIECECDSYVGFECSKHRCIWCGHRILRASKYIRERSIYDGRHQNMAWHEACRADALAGWRAGHDEEFLPGDAAMPFFALYQMEIGHADA